MFCGKCGNNCEDGAVFCPECGASLVESEMNQQSSAGTGTSVQPAAPVNQQPAPQAPVYQQPAPQAPAYSQGNTYQSNAAYGQPGMNNGRPQGYQQAPDYQQMYGQIPAAPQAPNYQQAPGYGQPQPAFNPGQTPVVPLTEPVKGNACTTWGLILGIFSLILATVGAPIWGIYLTGTAVVLGIIGIILSSIGKKKTNGRKGTGGFVTSLLGLIFGLLFSTGCVICGIAADEAGVKSEYGMTGCVGIYNQAKNDTKYYSKYNNSSIDFEDLLEDLF